ncbi:MAG: hypothetical protein IT497_05830 [Ottowia sp.]|nr:hypothetical protein [Ottowia sp.]
MRTPLMFSRVSGLSSLSWC